MLTKKLHIFDMKSQYGRALNDELFVSSKVRDIVYEEKSPRKSSFKRLSKEELGNLKKYLNFNETLTRAKRDRILGSHTVTPGVGTYLLNLNTSFNIKKSLNSSRQKNEKMTVDNSKREEKDQKIKNKFVTKTISLKANDLSTKNQINSMQSIEKPRKHINSILIEKFSSRKPNENPSLNENRFENIDKLPLIYSKNRKPFDINIAKFSSRKPIINPHNINFGYFLPDSKIKNAINMEKVTSRIRNNSIYNFEYAPDVEEFLRLNNASKKLSTMKKNFSNVKFAKQTSRDDLMYRVNEAYNSDSFKINKKKMLTLLMLNKKNQFIKKDI